MESFLNSEFFGNSIAGYLTCVLLISLGLLIIRITKSIVVNKFQKFAEKTTSTLDDFLVEMLNKVFLPLITFTVIFLGLKTIVLHPLVDKGLNVIMMTIITVFSVQLLNNIVAYSFNSYWTKRGKEEALQKSLKSVLKVIKIIIWGVGLVFLLDNLGFKISAVIAGLGIGGVAVALAAQTILGDLFSYFAILFDRPFEVGDFIIVGDCLGEVQHIGIKTTRIMSLSGEQIVFSNSDLTNSRLRNYKRMQRRRVLFKFGVVYNTSLEALKEIPKTIENIIKSIEDTTFDRAHFFSYGDFSLIFEVVYYVKGGDYNKYMNIQQAINFRIKEEFEKRKIEFAFPTQTVLVSQTNLK